MFAEIAFLEPNDPEKRTRFAGWHSVDVPAEDLELAVKTVLTRAEQLGRPLNVDHLKTVQFHSENAAGEIVKSSALYIAVNGTQAIYTRADLLSGRTGPLVRSVVSDRFEKMLEKRATVLFETQTGQFYFGQPGSAPVIFFNPYTLQQRKPNHSVPSKGPTL